MAIKVGDEAPDFRFTHKNGSAVHLKDLRRQKAVVLYFYPKDDTPGCTTQACSFRDAYEDFIQAGAEVIGVSSDGKDSHEAFAARYRLPFTLVSDAQGELRKRYGVPRSFQIGRAHV